MGGGLIQLVAHGIQDVVLIDKPQITLFKTLYRRYSNFSIEQVPQNFNKTTVALGDTVSCKLGRAGDLVYRVVLVATLPPIPPFMANGRIDTRTTFAWARRIGFVIISKITVSIGGIIIDSQTGEWMNIWYELTHPFDNNINRLIGDVPELTQPSGTKDAYCLHVPLTFWFCKDNVLALPVVALNYNQIQIDVEFADASKCYTISPASTLQLLDDTVQFIPGEHIEQTVNGQTACGQFIDFDPITRTLWYNRISVQPFMAATAPAVTTSAHQHQHLFINQPARHRFAISGRESQYSGCPQDGAVERTIRRSPPTIVLSNCHLDVDYVYLDNYERARICATPKEYLIEQVQCAANRVVQTTTVGLRLALMHPIRTIMIVVRGSMASRQNDWFNYTTSPYRDGDDRLTGANMVVTGELLFNGRSRTGVKPGLFFNRIQPLSYFRSSPSTGINIYSFSLFPMQYNPSGAANCTMIDNIELKLKLDACIGPHNPARVQVFGIGYNVLRTSDGLGGVLFTN